MSNDYTYSEKELFLMCQSVNSIPSKCFNCPVIRKQLEEINEPCLVIRKYNYLENDCNCKLYFEPITIDTIKGNHYN